MPRRARPRSHPLESAKNLRCVIYTRISRDDTMEGRANDRQEKLCRAKAAYKEYDIVEVVPDISVSAYDGKVREGWQKVLGMVRLGLVDVILAYHMDRITRSMKDLEELIDLSLETGVQIDTATGDIELTSDMGRMLARILAAVARAEVERKSQRQIDAHEQRVFDHRMPHKVKCFGYSNDGMTVIEQEAKAIREAASDVLAGTAITEIRERWVEAFPDRAPATNNGVRWVLLNPRYAGLMIYLREETGETGTWPTILDMDMHLALKRLLGDPERVRGTVRAQGRTPTTLLTGIATCKTCEQGTKSTKAHGVLIYGCRGGNHVNTPREAADRWVLMALSERLARPDFFESIMLTGEASDLNEAKKELTEVRRKKNALVSMFNNDQLDETQLASGTVELNEKIKHYESILKQAPLASTTEGLSVGTPAVADEVEQLPLTKQRALVQHWLDVRLVPRGKGNHRRATPVPIEQQVLISARA